MVQVRHVRALKDLRRTGRVERPCWVQVMAARQRQTLVGCRRGHVAIHRGKPTQRDTAPDATRERRGLQKA
ncbi:MAG: hypothetical protein ACREOH_01910 [Candidatus Entotheonellia bacterium]